MSAAAPHMAPRNDPAEDCRDYLRTGRCKYGGSCKYNHPTNVQSGGGMKAPLDPTEPLFPVRQNEPVCTYYMKHGTCKFGQACKFNHPPQTSVQAVNGGTLLLNVGRRTADHLVLNTIGTDSSGSSMMLQFLPQRPDEPDCIYFLKNGRCKYGATCRYHHPMNYRPRRMEDSRRHLSNQDLYQAAQPVQYIGQNVHGYPQQHVIVTENPVTFINVDNNYNAKSIISGTDGITYAKPVSSGIVTDQGSTASSVASSFDTASSSLDPLATGDSTAALWNRARRNVSGGSLNAYAGTADTSNHGRAQPRAMFPHVSSEGNIAATRRTRAVSYGSANDHSTYIDSKASPPLGPSWRPEQLNPSFEHARRLPPSQIGPHQDSSDGHDKRQHRPQRSRPHPGQARRGGPRNGREGDEGFTMMTSALLTMLDTPEEASAEGFSDDDLRLVDDGYQIDPREFDRLALETSHQNGNQVLPGRDEASWSPTWRARSDGARTHSLSGAPRGHLQPSNHESDIGLFLP